MISFQKLSTDLVEDIGCDELVSLVSAICTVAVTAIPTLLRNAKKNGPGLLWWAFVGLFPDSEIPYMAVPGIFYSPFTLNGQNKKFSPVNRVHYRNLHVLKHCVCNTVQKTGYCNVLAHRSSTNVVSESIEDDFGDWHSKITVTSLASRTEPFTSSWIEQLL